MSNSQIGILAGSGNFGMLVFLFFSGILVDKFGSLKMIFSGLVGLSIVIFLIIFLSNYYILIISFIFLGLFYSFIVPSTTKFIASMFSIKDRATYMGIKQTLVPIGGALSAFLIVNLSSIFSFEWRFSLFGISVTTIVWLLFLFKKRHSKGDFLEKNISPNGSLSNKMIKNKIASIFKERLTYFVFFSGFLFGAIQFSVFNYLVPFMMHSYNLPIQSAMISLIFLQAGAATGRIFWGYISDNLFKGDRIMSLLIISFSFILIIFIINYQIEMPVIIIYFLAFALGMAAFGYVGIYFTLGIEMISNLIGGLVSSLCATFISLGGVISPVLFGYIVDLSGEFKISWLLLIYFQIINILVLLYIIYYRKSLTELNH